MTWNDDGQFGYKGKVIQNSDIEKLITHTLWNNNKTDLKGLKIFYQALSSLNLPKHLITNKIGRSIMKMIGTLYPNIPHSVLTMFNYVKHIFHLSCSLRAGMIIA